MDTEQKPSGVSVSSSEKATLAIDSMTTYVVGLKEIRTLEQQAGIRGQQEVKVLMTTALSDPKNVFEAYFKSGATSYIVKPYSKDNVIDQLQILGLPS